MTTGFRGYDLDGLFDLTLPEIEWVVDGLLPLGAACLFSAREKSGKGLLAIDLLASLAMEEPFVDRAVRPCSVGYFAGEESL